MKRIIFEILCLLLSVLFIGCGAGEDEENMSLFSKEKIVGADIKKEDITDFYYTEENINYDAFYQRYRIYDEDGKHMFFHETRERKGDYGPCTDVDTTLTGTIELTDDQWSQFYNIVSGGTVRAREESAESGGTGPWLYLYWTNDKSKYQEFSFSSYENEKKFVDFCVSLISEDKSNDENSDNSSNGENSNGDNVGDMTPQAFPVVTVGDRTFSFEFEDNTSAEAFFEKLRSDPVEITMHDYGSFEKVGDLPWKLPQNDEKITTAPGDIILYQGNQITIYYDENTWDFTKLGKIDATDEEIKEVFGGEGDITATFYLEWTE